MGALIIGLVNIVGGGGGATDGGGSKSSTGGGGGGFSVTKKLQLANHNKR